VTKRVLVTCREEDDMAWNDWRDEVPKVVVQASCIDVKRRVPGQSHVLFRLVDPIAIENKWNGEQLIVPAGTLSDGSSVPGILWGGLDADPADLLLPGFAHDFAYRRGARWRLPGGGTREIDRYEADLLHIAVSRLLRVKKSDQAKIFYALRLGGGSSFQKRDVGWDGTD
jgi:hypothetical protein